MAKVSWHQVLPFALAAFLLVGSLVNMIAPGPIYEEYLRWGYPPGFHFFTGTMESMAAVMLLRESSRVTGAVFGFIVMSAALATVIIHGEYAHAVLPLIVATLAFVVARTSWRKIKALPAGGPPE
ncbi:MAG TPA: DoxX family protein [Luteibacter sp.]|uniref:DoxX family protein n=1 Tax=Luteibacter sp. TaxID=1886636 RepID=UPI002CA0D2DC|nr:DoxX family protein [Luteibacter sp.]HVI55509.1 DoxX family protein [Luteibacter sp.]